MGGPAIGAVMILVVIEEGAPHVIEVWAVHQPQASGQKDKPEDHHIAATGMRERSGLPRRRE